MRLTCQTAVAILAIATLACSDPLSPGDVAGTYVLESIGGHPLPAVIHPSPEEIHSILYGTITLDQSGNSVTVERRQIVTPNGPTELTVTRPAKFRLSGNTIEIGSFLPCPANANCAGNLRGPVDQFTISLALDWRPHINPIIYRYRRAP